MILAFDIETTGLDPSKNALTMVCVYAANGYSRSFDFVRAIDPFTNQIVDPEKFTTMREELLTLLDDSDTLCCYNGVEFELPFLAQALLASDEKLGERICKTLDVFFAVRYCIGAMPKLDKMLQWNGLQGKTASGLQAIEWARTGVLDKLEEYCMDDARLTLELHLKNPQIWVDAEKTLFWSRDERGFGRA